MIELLEVGMDVARVNFSHGSHEQHAQTISNLRLAAKKSGLPLAILGDLQGPKIRTGRILPENKDAKGFMSIQQGQLLHFHGRQSGEESLIGNGSAASPLSISYPRLGTDLRPGEKVLLDDGLIQLEVVENFPAKNLIVTKVAHGRSLGENKGVNMPSSRLSLLGLTEKDFSDVQFAIDHDLDFLALSFVRSVKEVRYLKEFLKQRGAEIQVIAKIEKQEALNDIDAILDGSDGIMVARGDLAVEIGNEKVPIVQKQLIQKTRSKAKPVITATQMLMSMIDNPTPSRAEASDVANAVLDGSDAVMLSNETATGNFPIEAVRTMSNIIRETEALGEAFHREHLGSFSATGFVPGTPRHFSISEAIESVAVDLANGLNARCLTCLTRSGRSARLLSREQPAMPIYAFSANKKVANQLCLTRGVFVIPWQEVKDMGHSIFDELLDSLGHFKLLKNGDMAVMTAGIPTSLQVGTTNTVVVRTFPSPHFNKGNDL